MDFQKVFYGLFDRISFKFTRYLEPQSYLVVRRTNTQMLKTANAVDRNIYFDRG